MHPVHRAVTIGATRRRRKPTALAGRLRQVLLRIPDLRHDSSTVWAYFWRHAAVCGNRR